MTFVRKITMTRIAIVCFAVVFFVVPIAALLVGMDPWICFLCGFVLMVAAAFAGIALFAFPARSD